MTWSLRARESFLETWKPSLAAGPDRVEDALLEKDPKLGLIIRSVLDRVGAVRPPEPVAASGFDFLVRAVVYQQLSKSAAGAIYARLVRALRQWPCPDQLLGYDEEWYRSLGLSRNKAASIRALAQSVLSGSIDLSLLEVRSDEDVIGALSMIHGVGRWTSKMFLIFHLGRWNVLPIEDRGIRATIRKLHGAAAVHGAGVKRIVDCWNPYASIASLYIWVALDTGGLPS